jgi:hypothetical protein
MLSFRRPGDIVKLYAKSPPIRFAVFTPVTDGNSAPDTPAQFFRHQGFRCSANRI